MLNRLRRARCRNDRQNGARDNERESDGFHAIPHRRRPPPLRPLLRPLLLRLLCPRWLAERCELPLEYPENASELAPLRVVARWLV
jgi:hypothetical protein